MWINRNRGGTALHAATKKNYKKVMTELVTGWAPIPTSRTRMGSPRWTTRVARLAARAHHASGAARGPGQGAARSRRHGGTGQGAGLAGRIPCHRPAARTRIGNPARCEHAPGISARWHAARRCRSSAHCAAAAAARCTSPSRPRPIAPGITLLDGAGCNVVALKGPEGSLLIDGGYARNSRAAARRPPPSHRQQQGRAR